MYSGRLVFSQVMEHLPWRTFYRCVQRYNGNYKVKSLLCSEQFRCMAFAQLTYRESLRDIETCLQAQSKRLQRLGSSSRVSRNTLANANRIRDWHIYADFAQRLIGKARSFYHDDNFGVDIETTVYALDSSTIDLYLAFFPWTLFRKTKSAVKLHTLLDLCGYIPAFIHISDGKLHDGNVLDLLVPEPGAFYVMDRPILTLSACMISIRPCASLFHKPKPTPNTAVSTPAGSTAQPDLSAIRRFKLTGANPWRHKLTCHFSGTKSTGSPTSTVFGSY